MANPDNADHHGGGLVGLAATHGPHRDGVGRYLQRVRQELVSFSNEHLEGEKRFWYVAYNSPKFKRFINCTGAL
jgi:hypothetical protein